VVGPLRPNRWLPPIAKSEPHTMIEENNDAREIRLLRFRLTRKAYENCRWIRNWDRDAAFWWRGWRRTHGITTRQSRTRVRCRAKAGGRERRVQLARLRVELRLHASRCAVRASAGVSCCRSSRRSLSRSAFESALGCPAQHLFLRDHSDQPTPVVKDGRGIEVVYGAGSSRPRSDGRQLAPSAAMRSSRNESRIISWNASTSAIAASSELMPMNRRSR